MKDFEYFETTADIGFYSYGNDLNNAFETAGLAIFNIISNTKDISPKIKYEFEIASEDKISLLYDYLEELLFLHETEFMLFSEFNIKIENNSLKAIIKGEKINWDKHERKTEIKAITFHKVNIKQDNPVKLQVIVDL